MAQRRNSHSSNKQAGSKAGVGRNRLRVIAGQWRGRRFDFPELPGLRPTTDRVRETLFNWLQWELAGATCLDAFAGSGALSLEALSRGASRVIAIDTHPEAIASLLRHQQMLGVEDRLQPLQTDSLRWLQQGRQRSGLVKPFDLVFVDPPFRQDCLMTVVQALESGDWLAAEAKIYLEFEQGLLNSDSAKQGLPSNWVLEKQQAAGQVQAWLLRRGAP